MPRVGKIAKVAKSKKSWKDLLEEYLTLQRARGLRESTIKSQREVIDLFFRRHPDALNDPKQAVLSFMAEDISASTYNIRLAYLRPFFDFCIEEGVMSDNPLKGLKRRKADGRIVSLDVDTLRRLLELPDSTTFAGLRDYALILLMLDTGIRPKEAFGLLLDDINLKAREVYVRADVSKTKIHRTLPISDVTAQAIRQLINARHPEWGEDVPVFCSCEGTRMAKSSWRHRMDKYSQMLGVKIRPYDLRHAFALQFLRNGGNALALQRMLGHTDLSMTKRYVALTQQDWRDQHAAASPLNILIPQKKNRVRKIK